MLITIQIGNSDNRLDQSEWSDYIKEIRADIGIFCEEVHFDGGSRFDAPWQNACFVAEVRRANKNGLLDALRKSRMKFRQESVAVTFGSTLFV